MASHFPLIALFQGQNTPKSIQRQNSGLSRAKAAGHMLTRIKSIFASLARGRLTSKMSRDAKIPVWIANSIAIQNRLETQKAIARLVAPAAGSC
jgi:hypothetical protein